MHLSLYELSPSCPHHATPSCPHHATPLQREEPPFILVDPSAIYFCPHTVPHTLVHYWLDFEATIFCSMTVSPLAFCHCRFQSQPTRLTQYTNTLFCCHKVRLQGFYEISRNEIIFTFSHHNCSLHHLLQRLYAFSC